MITGVNANYDAMGYALAISDFTAPDGSLPLAEL